MAKLADRVKETTTTTGTGTYSLAGAADGYQAFSDAFATTDEVYYCVEDGTDWEVGIGTLTTGTPWTLARTSILASSNADAAVNWAAGTKNVFCTVPAERAQAWENKKVLVQTAVPSGIPSSGTISNDGALAVNSAFVQTYSGGVWLYFPANAIHSGSAAGFYWTVMSSTTAGTIYNVALGAGEVPYIPSSPAAFSSTGPGGYTQTISTYLSCGQFVVPGGTLGVNGKLVHEAVVSLRSSANTKILLTNFGGQTFHQITGLTTTVNYNIRKSIQNRGVLNSQIIPVNYAYEPGSVVSGSPTQTSIDTSADQDLLFRGRIENASEWIVYESMFVEVFV